VDTALTLVVLLTIVVAVSSLARRFDLSEPLVLLVVGAATSYMAFVPDYELTPELVLIGLLPPLLYASAIRMSLVDFQKNRRPILLLSVGLVIFTSFGIAVLMVAILPISFAAALALGAVLAPPDAVAATAIARKIGLPRRVVNILEGESLVNDATAIVMLRTAIVAIAGTVSVWEVGGSLLVSTLGGAAIGLGVALVVGKIRYLIKDDLTDVAVSLLTPWVAYLAAEQLHVPGLDGHPSGILAVVVAGLILGHKSPVIQSATSRMLERTNWATISFVLEGSVFLLIGMQVRTILNDLGNSELSSGRIIAAAIAALIGVIVLRFIWVFPATYLPRMIPRIGNADPAPSWRVVVIVSWAGMRGVVTLAAVFLLPDNTPYREVFVAIALFVTAGTLLIQGLTLPLLVRWLKVQGPDLHEDHLQEATIYQAVTNAGLVWLEGQQVPEPVAKRLRERSNDRTNAVWERLGGTETPSAQYSRVRAVMLAKEREEVLRIRALGTVDQTVLKRVLDALDVEESILDRLYEDETTADRETTLRPETSGGCEHLRSCGELPTPRTPDGCEECLRDGTAWVHLRLCLECGHVGCCDSSPQKHASKHFREVGHPVMRSFEPGEAWRWCFIDELTG
jgi:CPA1 family monovalent cation:H+ antiporter